MKQRYPRVFEPVDEIWIEMARHVFTKTGFTAYTDFDSSKIQAADEGIRWTENRTGIRTLDTFGYQTIHNVETSFPLLSVKRTHWPSVVEELLWFLRGSTNVKELQAKGVTIWDEWAKEDGSVGPVYGYQWRNWNGKGIDQLKSVIETLRREPNSRRLILSAWNPEQISDMALPPCHCFSQFHVENLHRPVSYGSVDRIPFQKLHLHLYQRSADLFLGVPFNTASYALMLRIVAEMVGMIPGNLITSYGSLHVYENHATDLWKLLRDYNHGKLSGNYRTGYATPFVRLAPRVASIKDPAELTAEDIFLDGYDPWPAVKADVAV